MINPKVSIVIPIFNGVSTIELLLHDLTQQTMDEIEIICIDDCSTDNSFALLKELALLDERISVYHNAQNVGVSLSRNVGIEHAKGEYISFIDSDDRVADTFIEKMYACAKPSDADMVRCDVIEVLNQKEHSSLIYPTKFESDPNQLRDQMMDFLIYSFPKNQSNGLWPAGVWNKIYKKSFLDDHSIRFISERTYPNEDFLFNLQVLLQTTKIGLVKEPLYKHYIYRSSMTFSSYNHLCFQKGIKTLEKSSLMIHALSAKRYETCMYRLECRLINALPFYAINELKRNPKGIFSGVHEIKMMLKHPFVKRAAKHVAMNDLNKLPGKDRLLQRILLLFIKGKV